MGGKAIKGYAQIHFRHSVLGLFPGGFSDIELAPTIASADASRFTVESGDLVVSDSRITSSKYELTIKTQTPDLRAFEMSYGEQAQPGTEIYYDMIETFVPLEAPYTIELDQPLTAENKDEVMITIFENGSWNTSGGNTTGLRLTYLATGTVATKQFMVDVSTPATPEVTFHSSQAGAPINISLPRTVTAKQTLGVGINPLKLEGGTLYASMKLISDAFPNGLILICPSLSKISGLNLKSAEIAEIENKYTVGVAAGKRTPFQMIEL